MYYTESHSLGWVVAGASIEREPRVLECRVGKTGSSVASSGRAEVTNQLRLRANTNLSALHFLLDTVEEVVVSGAGEWW